MNDDKIDMERKDEQDADRTENLKTLGKISDLTKGLQFGWKIEGGINPYYF